MRNFIAWIRRYGWVLVAAAVTALLLYGYVERVAVGEFLWGFVQWTFNEVAVPTIALAVVVYAVLRICGYHTLWGEEEGEVVAAAHRAERPPRRMPTNLSARTTS